MVVRGSRLPTRVKQKGQGRGVPYEISMIQITSTPWIGG